MVRKRTQQNGPTTDIRMLFYWNATTPELDNAKQHIYEVFNPNFIPRTGDVVNVKNSSPKQFVDVEYVLVEYQPSLTRIEVYVS